MRNPGGYAYMVNPVMATVRLDDRPKEMACEGVSEFDTFTCGHCGRVKHVKPRERPEDLGGLCKQCMKLICPGCVDQGCTPFEQKLERMEQREIAMRSYGF